MGWVVSAASSRAVRGAGRGATRGAHDPRPLPQITRRRAASPLPSWFLSAATCSALAEDTADDDAKPRRTAAAVLMGEVRPRLRGSPREMARVSIVAGWGRRRGVARVVVVLWW